MLASGFPGGVTHRPADDKWRNSRLTEPFPARPSEIVGRPVRSSAGSTSILAASPIRETILPTHSAAGRL